MRGLQVDLQLIAAKQSLQYSCVSACIGTACQFLSKGAVSGEAVRDMLEAQLGNRPVWFDEAAQIAERLLPPSFRFEPRTQRSLTEAIDMARGDRVVIVGMDAGMLYKERGGPRLHAMVITRVTTFERPPSPFGLPINERALKLIETFGHNQAVADPDPNRFGTTFSLAEADPAFIGHYLIVRMAGSSVRP